MCGIIGLYTNNFNEDLFEVLKELFAQSQIRGKHATGISYYSDESIKSIVRPIPSKEFIKDLQLVDFPKNLSLIGHCRYSTSDLEFNQPITYSGLSVAHNGVVTQEFPEKWVEHFGYKCETKNDSELILRSIENGKDPLIEFSGSSIACAVLNDSGDIEFFRNGNRPLWWAIIELDGDSSLIISSTKNIIKRTFEKLGKIDCVTTINKCQINVVYRVDVSGDVTIKNVDSYSQEQQLELSCSKYYKQV